MSAPAIGRADALKIARNLGKSGRPLPEAMAGDAEYAAAHAASGVAPAAPSTPPAAPAKKAPAKKSPAAKKAPAKKAAPRQPARTRPAAPAPPSRSTKPGYFSRAFSPSRAAGRVADATGMRRVTRGGDAGGLLLVLVIWPIAMATVKYGAEGPALWFRAKWLNQTPGDPGSGPTDFQQFGNGWAGAGAGGATRPKTSTPTRPGLSKYKPSGGGANIPGQSNGGALYTPLPGPLSPLAPGEVLS